MNAIVRNEISRLNAISVYSDMELDVIGDIVSWAMNRYKGVENITHAEMVMAYWKEVYNIS